MRIPGASSHEQIGDPTWPPHSRLLVHNAHSIGNVRRADNNDGDADQNAQEASLQTLGKSGHGISVI